VIVLSDDAGWSDLGCYGAELATPNIDALAAHGLRFRSFYTNARCSPSRASLLTGLWPHEVGVGDLCMPHKSTDLPGYAGNMDSSRATLPELLRASGYRTAMAGKWHLGGWGPEPEAQRFWPTERGFERYWGMLTSGQADYFAPRSRYRLDGEDWSAPPGFYATTATTDFALGFLDELARDEEHPFFLLVSYSAPHDPEQALPEDLARALPIYAGKTVRDVFEARARRVVGLGLVPEAWTHGSPPPKHRRMEPEDGWRTSMATKAAMLQAVDRGVGEIVARLDALGRLDDTLLVYLTDNGAAAPHAAWGNAPFAGAKGALDEGGLLAHCVVHWPAGLGTRGGSVATARAHLVDLVPTLAELCGVELSEPLAAGLAGESLAGLLRGDTWHRRRPMFWDLYGPHGMLDGRWKLHTVYGVDPLFDLVQDGTAQHDVARDHPVRVSAMRTAWRAWADRVGVAERADVVAAQNRNGFRAPRRGDGAEDD
jgi:arylsulfatase